MLSEFKAFIAKGNVLDLAVAVIIGAAFGKIVSAGSEGRQFEWDADAGTYTDVGPSTFEG